MAEGSKIIAAVVALVGVPLPVFMLLVPSIRTLFWEAVGRDVLNASLGLIVVFAVVIAISSWLWKRD
ncbi:MAG: hypothetical protein ACREAZ_07920 [Nitrososphaera sp.]